MKQVRRKSKDELRQAIEAFKGSDDERKVNELLSASTLLSTLATMYYSEAHDVLASRGMYMFGLKHSMNRLERNFDEVNRSYADMIHEKNKKLFCTDFEELGDKIKISINDILGFKLEI